jgi:GAF domain-containing protein
MVTALQIMADQVAAALDNARLFSSSSETVNAVRRAYGDLSRQEWAEWLGARSGVNLRGDARGVAQTADAWSPELERAVALGRTVQESEDGERWHLAIPIKVRGSVIGALDTHKPDSQWTQEEVSFLEQVVEQLELALDNARLYEDAQRLGIREQQLREIGARMQGTFDLDAMLRTVVADLAQALHVDSAYVQLTPGRSRLSGDGLLGSREDELGA